MTARVGAGAATLIILCSASLATQEPPRAVGHGVRLIVSVLDGGRPVRDLTAEDFQLWDSGVPQRVQAATSGAGLAVAVIVDASPSVKLPGYEDVIRTIDWLVNGMESSDVGWLISLSDKVSPPVGLTTTSRGRQPSATGVGNLIKAVLPRSVIWDGVLTGATLLSGSPNVPLMLLFSDGLDNASWLSQQSVTQLVSRSGIPLDFIRLPSNAGTDDDREPGRQVPEELAAKTGGRTYDASESSLREKLERRLAELRAAYVLTYTPEKVKTGNGWHDIRVKLVSRRGQIRTRSAYLSYRER